MTGAASEHAKPGAAPPVPGRLAWRCRRGMKELDLVLGRYLQQRWHVADAAERAMFEEILTLPDPVLAAYLLRSEHAADPAMARVLGFMRQD
jgi:antitoxin CptB